MQSIWNWILAALPDNEPATANAIAAWLQGIATVAALGFSLASLRLTLNALRHQMRQAAESARPRVVFDYHQADGVVGSSFVARNVGTGAALNAYFFDTDPRAEDARFITLGGLLAEQQIQLATDVGTRLNREVADAAERVPLYILAEPAVGGDWMLSVNRVVANSRMSHEVTQWEPPSSLKKKLKALTIDEQLRKAFREMKKDDPDDVAPT
jgi:hypothetical protein